MAFFVGLEDLQEVDIFQGVSEFALAFLAKNTRIHRCEAGRAVVKQGHAPDCCYFILDGICHIRTPETYIDKRSGGVKNTERHQGYRGIGDSIGITAALAHYAYQSREINVRSVATHKQVMRAKYESLLKVGQNTAHSYAVVPSRFLECPREVLLTAIQICPVLVANIAWSLSLRMQQDTRLQQRAAQTANECLPVVAQFLYEWAMTREIYFDAHPELNKDAPIARMPDKHEIYEWLRISDGTPGASAFRFLRMEPYALAVMVGRTGGERDDVLKQYKAIDGQKVVNPDALLEWCRTTESRELIRKEVESNPEARRAKAREDALLENAD